jgi:hypothetical protein
VAQVVEANEDWPRELKAEIADLLAHVLVEALGEGGSEAKEDADRVDQQERVPLLLAGGDAKANECEIPVGVRAKGPADEGRERLKVLARAERDRAQHAKGEVELVARDDLVLRLRRHARTAVQSVGWGLPLMSVSSPRSLFGISVHHHPLPPP